MKKTYIEPKVKEINVRFEALMMESSPTGPREIPGSKGLGTELLTSEDEGLAKEDVFGW